MPHENIETKIWLFKSKNVYAYLYMDIYMTYNVFL